MMFKVSSILADTAMQSLSPLADCSGRSGAIPQSVVLLDDFNVTDPAAVGRLGRISLMQQAINASNWPVFH